jgi:glutamine synthetase
LLVDPNRINEEERRELEVTQKLPSCVSDGFVALKADSELASVLGADLIGTYLSLMEAYNKRLELYGDLGSQARFSWLSARL